MLFLMLVSLYTSRIILNALGIEDYGVYNVVGGVVAMFGVLSGAVSVAIGRFITFELGRGDEERLKKVFSTSMNMLFIIIISILVLAESIGLWFLNSKMVFPEGRIDAANIVYQISLLTFITSIVNIPFNATIIAHEKMSAFAYISIFEALGKLLTAFLVVRTLYDKLIYYAITILVIAILTISIYIIYCKFHFKECKYSFEIDKDLFKEIFGLAGWESVGSLSIILKNQGNNVLINLFFGTVVNAAFGVASQVSNAIHGFITNFMMALNPQIIKSYAINDHNRLMSLIYKGARYSYYLMLLLSLPILLNTHNVLVLWLKIVPEHAETFVRLVLIYMLSETLSGTLKTAQTATGKIRTYKIIIGSINLTAIPISYVLLKIGAPPEVVYLTLIMLSNASLIVRIPLLKKMVGISIRKFLKEVYLNVIVVSAISVVVPFLLRTDEIGWLSLILSTLICLFSVSLTVLLIGLSRTERNELVELTGRHVRRYIKR